MCAFRRQRLGRAAPGTALALSLDNPRVQDPWQRLGSTRNMQCASRLSLRGAATSTVGGDFQSVMPQKGENAAAGSLVVQLTHEHPDFVQAAAYII